jgi:hypothetical protein
LNLSILADLDPHTLWNAPNGSVELVLKCLIALLLGGAVVGACFFAPAQFRRYIIFGATFLSGLFYVLFYYFPTPIARQPADLPRNPIEGFSFWLTDAQPIIANISNAVAAFLIGLGIYSLLRVHLRRLMRQQKDWAYSVVLLVSMVLMVFFGYWDFYDKFGPRGPAIATGPTSGVWHFQQYANDLLFDGFLQQMDAGMFSVVAFFILSAAYRAFRARSVEATILLVSALVLMLSVMGAVVFKWNQGVTVLAHNDAASFLNNFKLSTMAQWLKDTVQTPSIRGIDFGVGIGLLAMGLRLWLNLDKTGGAV